MRNLLIALMTVLLLPGALHAQDAAAIRGGWLAEVDGRTQIYLLIVRGAELTGTHCSDCSDPRHLGFVLDGRLDAGGVHFSIRHEYAPDNVTVDEVLGRLQDRNLVLSVRRRGSSPMAQTIVLHRAIPSLPAAPPAARAAVPYLPPGPPQVLDADAVVGLWLWGAGPNKQYFMIRRVGKRLLGMVCGPCENPATMAPLDDFAIDGANLRFDIVHEDTGGAAQRGPFSNVAHATLSHNEMHLKVIPSFERPDFTPIEMTLLGPVAYQ